MLGKNNNDKWKIWNKSMMNKEKIEEHGKVKNNGKIIKHIKENIEEYMNKERQN